VFVLKLTLESLEYKADERGYMNTHNKQTILELTVETGEAQKLLTVLTNLLSPSISANVVTEPER
jgi:hypothetical protein